MIHSHEMLPSVPPWEIVKQRSIPPHLVATPLTEENYERYCVLVREIESYPVTQFFSLTFGRRTSEAVAVRKVREWHDALEWLNKAPIGLLWCIESEGDELHVHGVLMGAPNLSLKTAESVWRFAGDGQVRRFERGRRGVAYSLKEAFWTGRWGIDHLDYYSVHGKKRRPRLARQYFNQHLELELANSLLPGGSFGFVCGSVNDDGGGMIEITPTEPSPPKSQPGSSGSGLQIEQPTLVSIAEAARILSKSKSTLYRMARKQPPSLHFVFTGRRIYVDRASLDAFTTTQAQQTSMSTARNEDGYPPSPIESTRQDPQAVTPSKSSPAPTSDPALPDCRQRGLTMPEWPRRVFGIAYPA